MLTFEQFRFAFELGVFAYIFTNVLIAPDGVFAVYYNWICALPVWLFKPLGGCAWCFAGQLSLWWIVGMLITACAGGVAIHWHNWMQSIIFITTTIFWAKLITHIINKLNGN